MKQIKEFFKLILKINSFGLEDQKIKKLILPTFIITALLAGFPMLNSYSTSQIWNAIQISGISHDTSQSFKQMLLLLSIWIIPFFIRVGLERISARFDSFFHTHINKKYREKISSLDYAYFDDPEFHDLLKNTDRKGVGAIHGLYNTQFDMIDLLVSLILTSIALSTIGTQYIVIMIIGSIPLIFLALYFKKSIKRLNDENTVHYRNASAYEDQAGKRETRIFLLNTPYLDKAFSLIYSLDIQRIKLYDRSSFFTIFSYILFAVCFGFTTLNIIRQASLGNILIGTATFQITTLWMFSNTLRGITQTVANIYEKVLDGNDFFKVMNLPSLIIEKSNAIKVLREPAPEIIFENVCFQYPGKEKKSLSDVSVKIASGEKIALVGENGGGKSTFIKLLMRFYDPLHGRILINGNDLRDVDLNSFRDLVGYVAQSPSIPHLTIAEILSHEQQVSVDMIDHAIKRSRSDKFINDYSNGINQRLGKMFTGGVSPSDGQSQRLAIARAYSKNPKLLIFDEPTADLDPETQNHIFDDLYQNNDDKTGILVAHSLQGVIDADKIIVFENGMTTQLGTHNELLNQPGWYYNSFTKQFSKTAISSEIIYESVH